MKKELKDLLIELLTHEDVVGSWGLTKIRTGKRGVSFHVSAFKYQGDVQIRCLKKGYSITFGKTTIKGLELSNVVEVIDNEIELSPDYVENVTKWVGKKQSLNSTIVLSSLFMDFKKFVCAKTLYNLLCAILCLFDMVVCFLLIMGA